MLSDTATFESSYHGFRPENPCRLSAVGKQVPYCLMTVKVFLATMHDRAFLNPSIYVAIRLSTISRWFLNSGRILSKNFQEYLLSVLKNDIKLVLQETSVQHFIISSMTPWRNVSSVSRREYGNMRFYIDYRKIGSSSLRVIIPHALMIIKSTPEY